MQRYFLFDDQHTPYKIMPMRWADRLEFHWWSHYFQEWKASFSYFLDRSEPVAAVHVRPCHWRVLVEDDIATPEAVYDIKPEYAKLSGLFERRRDCVAYCEILNLYSPCHLSK